MRGADYGCAALLLVLTGVLLSQGQYLNDNHDHASEGALHYMNLWIVKVKGGQETADRVARDMDYDNLGPMGAFPDTYIMRKRSHPSRSKRHARYLTKRLSDDEMVEWAEQQYAKRRDKRDLLRMKREDMDYPITNTIFNDPLWGNQWYLQDTRTSYSLPKLDLHVLEAWQKGYTGTGVSVTILDDGLEWNHTDIYPNYDPKASYDANDNDYDPFPRYDAALSNRHGTRCAGEVAMVANNRKCGVGVAFNSSIGGIRMLDGVVSDMTEGNALCYNIDHIDVYSASWGPTDDGRTVEGPGRLALQALEMGINKGRGGKGVIYVWAAGNGGSKGDNCNCDGYTSSIYTLSVGSASQQGKFPWYGEKCASTMTSTYSSGAYTDQKISSVDLHNDCTTDHTGTSAAAPLAAGIVALVLQANPYLTWRDVQYLAVLTSDPEPLIHNDGWKANAAGLKYNSRFGFGLMNAASMVDLALNWTNVPQKSICPIGNLNTLPLEISSGHTVEVYFNSDNCKGTSNEVMYLEHVEVLVNIDYTCRGALEADLTSPSGTRTTLLLPRQRDVSIYGFKNWKFMSVHTWGENPNGKWKLNITDNGNDVNNGYIKSATLILHGTKEKPHAMKGKLYKEDSYLSPDYSSKKDLTSMFPNQDQWSNRIRKELLEATARDRYRFIEELELQNNQRKADREILEEEEMWEV